jgi:archaemetzincin
LPIDALHLVSVGPLARTRVEDLARRLSRRTSATWRVSPLPGGVEIPQLRDRDQVDADALLASLEAISDRGRVLVGLTTLDLAIPVFTFVFGRARKGGRAAVVSLARLDPAFYGLPADGERLAERATAEVLHELGHVAGLVHCPDAACLMSFAGSVEKVDVRSSVFCANCTPLLPRWLRGTQ